MNNGLLPTISISSNKNIEDCIYNIRGQQVMLDSDIAAFFDVDTKRINEQMKRNKARFPEDFCFQLNSIEFKTLKPQNATSNIGRGVEFIMNGVNHQMNSISTYPFYIFNGWKQDPTKKEDLPYKGDTVIGNDVWIGQNVTFLPGVHVGDGCIIGANAVVASNITPYSVVVGNPAKIIRKRFDDEMIELLEELGWWNKTPNQIHKLIPLLSNSDINYVKKEIKHLISADENR